MTMARLGLNWAERFAVDRLPLLRRSLRELAGVTLRDRVGRLAAGGAELTGAGAGVATARAELPSRLRSLLVSARLPRLLKASRRARTRSLLGLLMAARLSWRGGLVGPWLLLLKSGRVGASASRLTAGATGVIERVGRASAALRVRLALLAYRFSAVFPAVESAIRRARAASRLD
jgi:hypothetical protein